MRRRLPLPAVRSLGVRVAVLAVGIPLLAACSAEAPAVGEGASQSLVTGRSVWTAQCANCHGSSGGGGRGPQLNAGRVTDRFPDPASQVELIRDGRGGMPSFAGRLSDEEIEAVVAYTREVIATVE